MDILGDGEVDTHLGFSVVRRDDQGKHILVGVVVAVSHRVSGIDRREDSGQIPLGGQGKGRVLLLDLKSCRQIVLGLEGVQVAVETEVEILILDGIGHDLDAVALGLVLGGGKDILDLHVHGIIVAGLEVTARTQHVLTVHVYVEAGKLGGKAAGEVDDKAQNADEGKDDQGIDDDFTPIHTFTPLKAHSVMVKGDACHGSFVESDLDGLGQPRGLFGQRDREVAVIDVGTELVLIGLGTTCVQTLHTLVVVLDGAKCIDGQHPIVIADRDKLVRQGLELHRHVGCVKPLFGSRCGVVFAVAQDHRADRTHIHLDVVELLAHRTERIGQGDVEGIAALGSHVVAVGGGGKRGGKDHIRRLAHIVYHALRPEAAVTGGHGNDDVPLEGLEAGYRCGGTAAGLGGNGQVVRDVTGIGGIRPSHRPIHLLIRRRHGNDGGGQGLGQSGCLFRHGDRNGRGGKRDVGIALRLDRQGIRGGDLRLAVGFVGVKQILGRTGHKSRCRKDRNHRQHES